MKAVTIKAYINNNSYEALNRYLSQKLKGEARLKYALYAISKASEYCNIITNNQTVQNAIKLMQEHISNRTDKSILMYANIISKNCYNLASDLKHYSDSAYWACRAAEYCVKSITRNGIRYTSSVIRLVMWSIYDAEQNDKYCQECEDILSYGLKLLK